MDHLKKPYCKRIAAFLLALVMLMGIFPVSVFATENVGEVAVAETAMLEETQVSQETDEQSSEATEKPSETTETTAEITEEPSECTEVTEVPLETTEEPSQPAEQEEDMMDAETDDMEQPQGSEDVFLPAPIVSTGAMRLPSSDTNDYLKLNKTVSYKGGDNFLLTLEAFVTGQKREVKQPLDIVLTIDLTGSMHQSLVNATSYTRMYNYSTSRDSDATYANPRAYINYSAATGGPYAVLRKYKKENNKWTYTDTNLAPKNTFAVKSGNTFIPVTIKNGTWTDASGKTYSAKTHPGSGGTQIYTKGQVTRMDAMINAIVNFIEMIEQDAIKNTLNHRIALVSFQEFEYTAYPFYSGVWNGATMYGYAAGTDVAGRKIAKVTTNNYKNAFKVVTSGKASFYQSLGEMMKAPYYSKGTFPLSGIEMTNNVFANGSTGGNPRINVFFSDGEPNRGTDDDYYWSRDIYGRGSMSAIQTTKNTHKAQVFCVGIFGGANDQSLGAASPTSGATYANYFLQRISSNYNGSGNPVPSRGYYVAATTSEALASAFQKVLNRLVTNGGTNLALTGGSTLKDVISDNFKFPDNITPNDVKVYTAKYTADNTFGSREALTNAAVALNKETKTVEVTNFDYGANWCGRILNHLNEVTGYNGRKVIVEIPIVATKKGNNLATNANTSAVAEGEFLDKFAVPSVDIPVNVRFSKNTYNQIDGRKSFDFTVDYVTFAQTDTNDNHSYNNDNGSNGNYLSGKTRSATKEFTMGSGKGYELTNIYYGSVVKFKEFTDDAYERVVTYTTESNATPVVVQPDAQGYYQITATGGDITIQVTNIHKKISIPIRKKFVGVSGGQTSTFNFKVEVQKGSSWVALNTTDYPRLTAMPTVTLSSGSESSVIADIRFAPGDLTDKILRFTEIPVEGVLCDTAQFQVHVTFDKNGEPVFKTNGTGTLFEGAALSFVNTQLVPLELKKRISGNAADPFQRFKFKVDVTLSNGSKGSYEVVSLEGDAKENGSFFELADGGVVKLRIPYGAKVAVEETDSKPYSTVITVNGKTEGSHNGTSVTKTELTLKEANNTIQYENRYQILIDTGVVLESLPYILILIAVAVGALWLFGKRKNQED